VSTFFKLTLNESLLHRPRYSYEYVGLKARNTFYRGLFYPFEQ